MQTETINNVASAKQRQIRTIPRVLAFVVNTLAILISGKINFLLALFSTGNPHSSYHPINAEQSQATILTHNSNIDLLLFEQKATEALTTSGLFSSQEAKNIMIRLGEIHSALNTSPFFTVTDRKFDVNIRKELFVFLVSSPTLLGIKPVTSHISIRKEQLNKTIDRFTHWVSQTKNLAQLRLAATNHPLPPDPDIKDRFEDELNIIDMPLAAETVKCLSPNAATNTFIGQSTLPAIRSGDHNQIITDLYSSIELCGILFGYPPSAVKHFITQAGNNTKSKSEVFQSRWLNFAIGTSTEDASDAKRTIDRFDATVETIADYLSVVRKIPMESLYYTMRSGYYSAGIEISELGPYILPIIDSTSEARN
ncbi:MAG: hypothetical protein KJ811_05170 [Candidatus Margulisbacteria bacterium]|nr:hypothetical protein [Candidatus Margulisiibacteriota bacterium]